MGTIGRRPLLLLLPALACAAAISVAPPAIGTMRDCAGRARQVFGTPGAFVLGPPEAAPQAALHPLPDGAKIEGRTLILRRTDGSEARVPLPGTASRLERMAPGWLVAVPFAIQLTAGGATVYRLPMKACAEAVR